MGLLGIKSDVELAYVGSARLPEEAEGAIIQAFSSLAGDYNGDGRVEVSLHSYPSGLGEKDGQEGMAYAMGMEVALLGDIEDCDSFFFLLEDPVDFQLRYQMLSLPDGSVPDKRDVSPEGKGALWKELPALASQDLGLYEENILGKISLGDCQERLGELFVGRRYFEGEKTCKNLKECEELWNRIWEGKE